MPQFDGSAASIHYEQTGSGPDIVWVGGGGARGRDWQRFQTPHFKQRFRNTVFDNRGIGGTTCCAPMPWPIERLRARPGRAGRGASATAPPSSSARRSAPPSCKQLCIDRPDLVQLPRS